jgi:hypothetical protein
MTLVRYESLRALSRACRHWGFNSSEREKIFYQNAKNLVDQIRHR